MLVNFLLGELGFVRLPCTFVYLLPISAQLSSHMLRIAAPHLYQPTLYEFMRSSTTALFAGLRLCSHVSHRLLCVSTVSLFTTTNINDRYMKT